MTSSHRTVEGRRRARFVLFLVVLTAVFIGTIAYFMARGSVDVFSPVGTIGRQERSLIILALSMSLLVVIPVFTMTFMIAWRYRETNTRARYSPDWDHNRIMETVWWAIPILMISFLAVVAWRSSHSLDPNRPVASAGKPLTIQVVALQWRWLFLYPSEGVASLNYVQFPVNRPVHFEITADAPMNSFWIPKLGGQIYAMSGMSTNLNLIANQTGDYRGSSANISGTGFASMHFIAHASTQSDYDSWVAAAHKSSALATSSYIALARPSEDSTRQLYSLADTGLYGQIVDSYMHSVPLGATE